MLVLDNTNESSDELRDIRNGHVALIAGLPAVPNAAMTLACPPAKSFECVRTAEPKCTRTGSTPDAPLTFYGQDSQGEGLGSGPGSGAELSGAIWAFELEPWPRAPSQHLQAATNPLSRARMPRPLHFLLRPIAQQPSAHTYVCLLELHSHSELTCVCCRSQARARATSTT